MQRSPCTTLTRKYTHNLPLVVSYGWFCADQCVDSCPWREGGGDNNNNHHDCFKGRTLDDWQTALDWWTSNFPGMAIEVKDANIPVAPQPVTALKLHYTLRLWSSSEGQSFSFVDVSAAYWNDEDGSCQGCGRVGPQMYPVRT